MRSRSNIDDSEMNSKQERQGNQSAASVSVPRRKGEWIRIRGNSNDTQHVLASSRPSYRPGRPVIQAVIGHAPAAIIILSLFIAPQFFQARLAGRRLSATHPRLVLRLALSRLAERLAIIYIGLCPYMPYSLYRSVGSCSSGLLIRSRFIVPASNTVSPSPHPHHSIYPSHPCIIVSLYLSYTSHTSYLLYTSINET